MNKISLAILTFGLFFQSFGQIDPGIKGGLNVSNVKFEGPDQYTNRLGFNAGLLAQIHFSRQIFIRPEILFSVKGYNFPASSFDGAGTVSQDYLNIPILFGVSPIHRFAILFGPELGLLLRANSRFNRVDHDIKNYYNDFDMGLDLGITYDLTRNLALDCRYNYAFKDLIKFSYRTDYAGNIIRIAGEDGSNRVLQLGFYYLFKN